MWKEKLENYLIDVSKYFLTGVFVASLVKDLEDVRCLIYRDSHLKTPKSSV